MKRASKLSALDMLDKNIEKKSELKRKRIRIKKDGTGNDENKNG